MNLSDKSKEEFLLELETSRARVAELERYAVERGWLREPPQEDLSQLHNALEELRVAEEELRQQNEELQAEVAQRQQAEEAVKAERQRFNDVLETLPAYVVLLTPDYHVPFANRFFRERFGESHGRRCFEYLFNRTEPCENCETYKVLKTMQPHQWEWLGPDGRNYYIYDFPFKDTDGSTLIMETGIDITEQKQAQEALRKLNETLEQRVADRTADLSDSAKRFELLARTADKLLRASEPQKLVEELCINVMKHLDCHAFFNFLVDDEAGKLRLNACAGIPPEEAKKLEWLEYGVAVCGCAARDAVRIVAERIPTTPDERTELVKSCGIKAYACHPLFGPGGNVIGTLSFGTRSRETFSEDDLSLMKAIADMVAVAMIRIKNEQALRESREDLNRAQAVAHIGSWRLDVDKNELLWSDETYRIFGIPKGTALTYEAFLAAVHPDDRTHVDRKWNAALRGEPYDIDHRIVVDGIIKWVREKAELEFDREGKVLGGFGTAQDITERKRREEEIARQAAVLDSINRVFRETLQCEDIEEVARICLRVADTLTGSEFGFIVEVDEEGTVHAIALNNPGWAECRIPDSDKARILKKMKLRGYWSKVITEGRSVIVNDPANHPDRVGIPDGHPPITSFLGVPLKHNGKTFGMMALANRQGGYTAENQKDIEMLSFAFVEALNRKRADEELRQTRDYLENLFTYANAPIIVWDPSFRITRFNHAFERLTGYEAREVVGKDLYILFTEATRNESLNKIDRTLGGEYWESVEIPILRNDGQVRVVLWNSANIHAEDGKTVIATIAQGQDITERKQMEEALKASEKQMRDQAARLQAILDAAPVVIWIAHDRGCRHISGNRFGEELLRVPQGTNVSKSGPTPEQLSHFRVFTNGKELAPEDMPIQRVAVSGKESRNYNIEILYDDGGERSLLGNVIPVLDSEGKPNGAIAAFMDITERKQMEDALRESERNLAEAQRIARIGSWEWDISTDEVRWSDELYRIFGVDPRSFVPNPQRFLDLIHPDDRESMVKTISQAVSKGKPADLDFRVVLPDGSVRFAHDEGEVIEFDESGKPLRMVGTVQDITERKRAEEALKAARDQAENEKRRLEAVMEALPVGVSILDEHGGTTRTNKMFDEVWGARAGHTPPAHDVSDYVAYKAWWPETGKLVQAEEWAAAQALQNRETIVGQLFEIQRFDGTRGFVINSAAPVRDSAGNVTGSAVAIQDITELRRTQNALRESEARYRQLSESLGNTVKEQVEQLRQVESLAALGRMVSVVAHEVRNPLQNIRLGMDTLRAKVRNDKENVEILGEIEHGVNLLNDTVDELLEYSRPVRLEYASWPVEQVVEQALKSVPHRLQNITTDVELEKEDREIFVDATKMVRALVNIITNAAEAMPEGGNLRIKSTLSRRVGLTLTVSDTGHGMDAEALGKLFEPFHTTKTNGTGLGLAISKKIIEAHNGSITVKSKPNKGTTVKITLPIGPKKENEPRGARRSTRK